MTTNTKKALIAEKDFQALADILPDFIAKYETDGRIVYFNARLRATLGVAEMSEVVNKKPSECWPDGRFNEIEEKVIHCGATGNPDYVDLKVPEMPDRPMEFHHVRIVAEKNLEGEIVAVIAFGRDLTERVLLEQQLTASSRMASLGEMAGGIAHEVNNPLAIVFGKLRQLQRNVSEEQIDRNSVIKTTSEITETLERIAKIVKGLRTFSRDSSEDPFKRESIQEVLKDSLYYCEQRIKHKGVELETSNILNTEPIYIECRATEISQVLVNLLNNAHDAVIANKGTWIRVELKDCGDEIELAIIDSGAGISKEDHIKIMHPFFTTKPPGQGTGLGLSISKGIIDSHHGKLFFDSESKNTKFVISLPKFQPKA